MLSARRLRPPRRADHPSEHQARPPRRRDRRPHDRRSIMTAIAAEPARTTPGRRHSAFRNLVETEARLLVREIGRLLWGVGFPMLLLSVMGAFSHGPQKSLGGFSLVAAYEPVLL